MRKISLNHTSSTLFLFICLFLSLAHVYVCVFLNSFLKIGTKVFCFSLQVDGFIMGEEFFKAVYYGIPFSGTASDPFKTGIYSRVYLHSFSINFFALSTQHIKIIPDVSFNRTKLNKNTRITSHYRHLNNDILVRST